MTKDPRDILCRALDIDQEIQQAQEEQRLLEDRLRSLQGFHYEKPVVKVSGGRGSMEELAAEVADEKNRIAKRISALIQAKNQARALINTLPEGRERSVLEERYILHRSWQQVAINLGYSYRHVIRLHGEAIKHIRERCP